MAYRPTIGLEIHVELNTKSKMFCSCLNNPDEKKPNSNICPICSGHPGTLPVINQEAVKKVIKTGLALNCQIPEYSKFDRKNYFYPDLPKGYQISQLYNPLCIKGFLEVEGTKIRIREIHLEEDTGKLSHIEKASGFLEKGEDVEEILKEERWKKDLKESYSLVDLNRAGIPLMELATEPDMHSAKEAREFAEEIHLIMHYLGVSDADMEKGQMRVEVNISLSKEEEKLGTKVEIKNLNSFRSVERAADYEIKRQKELLEKGEKIIQETRGWNDIKGITFSQREKEEANDYRYFPEPDLPPLHFLEKEVREIQAEIPELPQQKRARFKREYELGDEAIKILVYNKDFGEYFEKVISELNPRLPHEEIFKLIKSTADYLITDLLGLLKKKNILISEKLFLITPQNFSDFVTLRVKGIISTTIAHAVLSEMFETGADPSHIIKEKGLEQVSDEKELEKRVEEVIKSNPKVIEDYKKGKENAFQYLIGQIMAKTKGRANPNLINKILNNALTKLK